jgi:hypothetical protein
LNQVDNILTNWNKEVLKKKNPIAVYNKILLKVDKVLEKNISDKLKVVLLYVKDVIALFKNQYLESIKNINLT